MMIVCRLKPCHHLNGNTDRLFCRKSSLFLYIIFQSDPFDKLHYHIVQTSVLTDVIHIDNVRMHQSCRSLRLTQKFLYKYLIRTIIAF